MNAGGRAAFGKKKLRVSFMLPRETKAMVDAYIEGRQKEEPGFGFEEFMGLAVAGMVAEETGARAPWHPGGRPIDQDLADATRAAGMEPILEDGRVVGAQKSETMTFEEMNRRYPEIPAAAARIEDIVDRQIVRIDGGSVQPGQMPQCSACGTDLRLQADWQEDKRDLYVCPNIKCPQFGKDLSYPKDYKEPSRPWLAELRRLAGMDATAAHLELKGLCGGTVPRGFMGWWPIEKKAEFLDECCPLPEKEAW